MHDLQPAHDFVQGVPAYPPIAAVVAHRRMLAALLRARGVPRPHLPDALQIVLVAAWQAIDAGRYRPDPSLPPSASLRIWLRGVAVRQAKNIRTVAWMRREVPTADPLCQEDGPEPSARLDAREALRAMSTLPPKYVGVLISALDEHGVEAYATGAGIPISTTWRHLREGRALLADYLAGKHWRTR